MNDRGRIGGAASTLVVLLMAAPAHAEHYHPVDHDEDASQISASISLLAAQYESTNYGGDYQGAIPSFGWTRGRYAAMVSIGMYRLEENGRTINGLGDTMAGGSMMIAGDAIASIGAMAMVMAPSGEHLLGMGHVMAMPSVFVRYHTHPLQLAASLGYSRAIGGGMEHAGHGGGVPLVEPMNMSEISWTAGTDLMVNESIVAGGRLSGGIPVGEPGVNRIVGGVRFGWRQGKLSTAAEIQTGLVGDPFTVRGVLETSVTF